MVDDLFEDMKDGVKLLALLEVLSGQKLVTTFPVTRLVKLLPFGIWGCGVGSVKGTVPVRQSSLFVVGNTLETLAYQSLVGAENPFPFWFLYMFSGSET